ncbi:unnamed protein product [Acanthoscelides obtectus]|uniref:Uncharacterized protein n=1 Tax=Acanthoscelides obtectus TaxID=200917 RepID=A0A9P0LTM1_ACAOB|nr:unnamed protein product [Acanthoscelides obtectus]CAK1672713.1 hypothetical protein AOBTE_LOCUS29062 [Acanthoscelides obtectus]
MCDSEIISLSSDEELPKSPPRKKIKPTYLGAITITPIKKEKYVKSKSKDDIVVLSDDDSNDVAITKGSEPSNKDKNGVDQTNTNERLGDVITNTLNEVTIIRKNATLDSKSTEKISTNGNIKVVDKVDEICEITESDSEEESSSGKENHSQLENEGKNEDSNSKQSIETSPNEVEDGRMTDESKANQTQSTQSHSDTTKPLLDQFLTICGKRMEGSKFIKLADEKFPILRRFYKKCDDVLNKNSEFKKLLLKCLNKSENASPEKATIAFNEVFTFVKEIADVSSIEVDKETRLKLKKLEHCMKALKKKIKKLEVAEIDFDDEEDSVYLQLDRYEYTQIIVNDTAFTPTCGKLNHT